MNFYVGTSGWAYAWNKGGNLEWYLENSGLNAVELNASFYRFPFPNQIKGWVKKTANFDTRWAIKVNRLITHIYKFGDKAFEVWTRFYELFKPLDRSVDFYLFQLPPSTTSKALKNIEKFFENTKLKERFALEPRNLSFFENDVLKNIEQMGMTFVSVDAPDLPRNIYATTDAVYLRVHGRESWYSYCYSEEELKEILEKIREVNTESAYIFFNNDHDMLENARVLRKLFD
jgi:uncharacterized protein YecE (DUF72 family)